MLFNSVEYLGRLQRDLFGMGDSIADILRNYQLPEEIESKASMDYRLFPVEARRRLIPKRANIGYPHFEISLSPYGQEGGANVIIDPKMSTSMYEHALNGHATGGITPAEWSNPVLVFTEFPGANGLFEATGLHHKIEDALRDHYPYLKILGQVIPVEERTLVAVGIEINLG